MQATPTRTSPSNLPASLAGAKQHRHARLVNGEIFCGMTDRPTVRASYRAVMSSKHTMSLWLLLCFRRQRRKGLTGPRPGLTSWYVRMQQQEKLMIQILNRMHWVHANSLTLIQPQHYPCLITCHVALLLIFLTQLFWSNSPLFLLNCVCVRFNSTLRLGDICRLNPREH